jgi:hypothetical protein
MKTLLKAAVGAAVVATAAVASATPSTTFWTPATTYMQPYLVPHVTYDTYIASRGSLQNDYGLTMGVLPYEKFQGEIGIDYFAPGLTLPSHVHSSPGDNIYLNAKLGIPENAFSPYQPGISAGIQSMGFANDYSNFNHLHAEVGKTFGPVGNFTVGGYYGLNKKLYVSSSGSTQQAGFMAAWTSADINIDVTGLQKINFIADYASGNNFFGAYGAGIGINFTPSIDILTGPVWFNDKTLFKSAYGADFMWSIQLDIDVDFAAKKKT